MNCSPSSSSVYGIFQARILEWVAISYFRGSNQSLCLYLSRWIFFTNAPPGKPLERLQLEEKNPTVDTKSIPSKFLLQILPFRVNLLFPSCIFTANHPLRFTVYTAAHFNLIKHCMWRYSYCGPFHRRKAKA